MLNRIRAEHILAAFIAGMFILSDIAIVWLFVMAMENNTPTILQSGTFRDAPYIQPDMRPSPPPPVITTRLGGTTTEKTEAINKLESALFNLPTVPNVKEE